MWLRVTDPLNVLADFVDVALECGDVVHAAPFDVRQAGPSGVAGTFERTDGLALGAGVLGLKVSKKFGRRHERDRLSGRW